MTNIDQELARRVVSYLRDRQDSLGQVQVRVDGGEVALTGTLASRTEKQLCLDACQRVAGVRRVDDQLTVA